MSRSKRLYIAFCAVLSLLLIAPLSAHAQNLAKRLILKDGTYQLATKWEIQGDRVHYYSAEREEWEDVPNSMVDWAATDKFEKGREAGAPPPEAVVLDKELEAERQAEELKRPQVAPGLRLPDEGGVVLLDAYLGHPELVELQQTGGQVNKDMKGNILRATINPIASAKQKIEVPGSHAQVQAHAAMPTVYVNIDQRDDPGADNIATGTHPTQPVGKAQNPQEPWDRFRIIRMQLKDGKRIAGDIKIAVYGKVSQEAKFVPSTAEQLTGGWVKITPKEALAPGEYAIVESLGQEGMNLFVWDFGVNPSAPENARVWKPEPAAANAQPDKPRELEKRQ